MADGSRSFNFPAPQRSRLRPGEIVVDLFAGGGGASEGLKQALGIDPALAYNHDELATVCASTVHHGVVECTLSPEQVEGAERVAAFLVKYYGTGANAPSLLDPMATVTTKDRIALVTVVIKGTPYVIVDIGLRMLKPHELFRAQGCPQGYIIDRTANGTPLKTTAAVRMVGNSVSPPPLRALAEANLDPAEAELRIAA